MQHEQHMQHEQEGKGLERVTLRLARVLPNGKVHRTTVKTDRPERIIPAPGVVVSVVRAEPVGTITNSSLYGQIRDIPDLAPDFVVEEFDAQRQIWVTHGVRKETKYGDTRFVPIPLPSIAVAQAYIAARKDIVLRIVRQPRIINKEGDNALTTAKFKKAYGKG